MPSVFEPIATRMGILVALGEFSWTNLDGPWEWGVVGVRWIAESGFATLGNSRHCYFLCTLCSVASLHLGHTRGPARSSPMFYVISNCIKRKTNSSFPVGFVMHQVSVTGHPYRPVPISPNKSFNFRPRAGASSSSVLPAALIGAFVSLGGVLFGYDTGTIAGIQAMPHWVKIMATETAPTGAPVITSSQTSLIVSILSAGTFFGEHVTHEHMTYVYKAMKETNFDRCLVRWSYRRLAGSSLGSYIFMRSLLSWCSTADCGHCHPIICRWPPGCGTGSWSSLGSSTSVSVRDCTQMDQRHRRWDVSIVHCESNTEFSGGPI